jgi:putative Ca2+/H+ antiporter (TMEM165/GDT1 family)
MGAFFASLGLLFLAELGDKSMLLVVTLASRHRAVPVLTAVTLSAAVLTGVAVLAGGAAGALLPRTALGLASGTLFIGFGLWQLLVARDDESDEPTATRAPSRTVPLVLTISAALVLAELGDKTQVATLSLTGVAPQSALLIWLGGTIGFVAADAIAVVIGVRLARLVPQRAISRVAAALFVTFGVAAIVVTLR